MLPLATSFTDPETVRRLALRFDTLRGESCKVSESNGTD